MIAILLLLSRMYQLNHSPSPPLGSVGDTEGKLEKYRWARGRDEWRWTEQGDWGGGGGVQSVTTIKTGAERHRGEREGKERERGERDKPVNFSSPAGRNHNVRCP